MKKKENTYQTKEIWGHLSFTSNFHVTHDIVIRASNGLFVKTVSKSQQDKTMIMKYHNFYRSCIDLQKLSMTKEFKHIPEKNKNTFTANMNTRLIK
jgi:hypothetical protein